MQSMLLPFFVLFPLVKAVTNSANDKRSSVNATVSFRRPSAVVVEADNSQTANVVHSGHSLQTDESEKRSANAVKRKHFKGLALFSDDPGIWPGAVVPYEYVPYLNDTQRRYVRYAINAFKINTCIKFRKRTERDMYYLLITAIPKKWCYSIVGRDTSSRARTNEGKFITELNMDPACFDGPAMIHELMHSIGFYHEHQREDRDPLVTAGPPDPNPEREYQERLTYSRTEAQYMGEYDSESVMHYPFEDFKPWIRAYFTRSDIDNINKLYKCSMKKNNMRRNAAWTTFTWNPRKVTRFLPATFLDFFVKVAQTALSVKIKTNTPIRKNTMSARNTRGRPAIGKNNAPWTTFRRNSKNAARTTPATWSPNNYRKYFEAKNARRTNAPARIYNKNVRNTRGRPAVGKNNAPRTTLRRNSKNAARTTPATWSSNNYRKYFEVKNARRTNAHARIHNKNARNTRGKAAIKTNNAPWTNFKRISRNAARTTPATWSSNNYRKYLKAKNARRTNAPARIHNKNARNTRGRPAIRTNYAPSTNFRRNLKNAAGNPLTWNSNNFYRRYFAGSIAVRKNTTPRGNNMNIRNTSGENIMRKYNPYTNAKRNPGNAAKRGLVSRSSSSHNRSNFAGNNKRKKTYLKKKFSNFRNTPGRNPVGMNRAAWNARRSTKDAAVKNFSRWRSSSPNKSYLAENNAMRKKRASKRYNSKGNAESTSERATRTNNNAVKRNSTRNAT